MIIFADSMIYYHNLKVNIGSVYDLMQSLNLNEYIFQK